MKPILKIILLAAAYLLTYILGSCTGLIHPACYAYVGAVLPLLTAAVEEMPAGYDQLMIPVINNIPVLIVVLVLTIPVAILAMRLAERSLKKQTEELK